MPFPKAVEQEVAAQENMSTEVIATAEPNPSLGKFFQFPTRVFYNRRK